MALDVSNVDYSTLNALTKEQYIPTLVDNIKKKSVLLSKFLSSSKPNASGKKIVVPVEYADANSSSYGFYSKYDDLGVYPDEFAKQVSYDWSQAHASVAISGFEERVNDNPEKLVDLLSSKMKSAEKSLMKFFSGVLYGSTAEAGFNDLKSIASQSSKLGGITPDADNTSGSLEAIWKGAFDLSKATDINAVDSSSSYGNALFDNFSVIIDEILREAFEVFHRDSGEQPKMIIVPQIVADAYEQHLSDKKRAPSMASSEVADAGFSGFKYRGLDMLVDPSCPAGEMFFINDEYLKMIHNRKANFSFTGFRQPVTQDAKVGHILWMGQLICTNRAKAVGRISGLPTDYSTVSEEPSE